MPFEIVRNDIIHMRVDAIVNTANPKATVGYGVDAAIHKKAGPALFEARKKIGSLRVGESAITPAFNLDAKYVIHTVGPIWEDGAHGEEDLLAKCYRSALELAKCNECESIAFPMLATGNYGFPKPLALQIAIREFSSFLLENDMNIYLTVFSKDAFALSEKLFHSVASYIDENYIRNKIIEEYELDHISNLRSGMGRQKNFELDELQQLCHKRSIMHNSTDSCKESNLSALEEISAVQQDWECLLSEIDAGFSETLLHLIDRTGKKDSEIYKKANVDRKLFSKIRNSIDYKPSKATALAFAIALELDLEETKNFIARAGYALSHSKKFDIIIEYFILNRNYDIFEINEVLFAFDQPLIGA